VNGFVLSLLNWHAGRSQTSRTVRETNHKVRADCCTDVTQCPLPRRPSAFHPMTNQEKLEQARTLYDAGLFRRKIINRTPGDIYSDKATLDCSHTADVPRSGDYADWQCSGCRRAFEPKTAKDRFLTSRYIIFIPAVQLVIFYAFMLPKWIEDGNNREAQKQREWQDLKNRVTQLEEQMKSRR